MSVITIVGARMMGSALTFSARENGFLATCGIGFHHDGHEGMCALRTKEKISDSHRLADVLVSRDNRFEISENVVLLYGERV